MNTYVIVTALVKYQNKYLIAKRASTKEFSPNQWEFISGFVEEKEPTEETILRELREETQLQGKVIKSSEPFTFRDEETQWIVIPYVIEVDDIIKVNNNPSDHSEIKWITITETEQYPDLHPFIQGFSKLGLIP